MLPFGTALIAMAADRPNTSSTAKESRFFEMRTYYAAPGKLDDLNARFRNHTRQIFEKHGIVNIGLCAVAALIGGTVGTAALLIASFFMSIMFPTIFAGSIRGLGDLTKLGSSLIVMAIIGGAVFTNIMGLVSDKTGQIRFAMLVPLLCFAVVGAFAASMRRARAAELAVA